MVNFFLLLISLPYTHCFLYLHFFTTSNEISARGHVFVLVRSQFD